MQFPFYCLLMGKKRELFLRSYHELVLFPVYETCKLGTHTPQSLGNQMEIDSGKLSSSGFVLLDCPQSMKIESSNSSLLGSISDFFLSLSNGWDLTSFLKSLSKVLKTLKLGSCLATNPKEGTGGPCTVSLTLLFHNIRLKYLILLVHNYLLGCINCHCFLSVLYFLVASLHEGVFVSPVLV